MQFTKINYVSNDGKVTTHKFASLDGERFYELAGSPEIPDEEVERVVLKQCEEQVIACNLPWLRRIDQGAKIVSHWKDLG